MRYLKVNLWGYEIGRLVWDAPHRRTYFVYNSECTKDIPDIAPLLSSAQTRNLFLPIYGDDAPLYQGLPPFIADSLPDAWGNTLFERWIKENRIPRSKVTPLYKLMFIGTRGMGALEYEPCAEDLSGARAVDVKSLYDISLRVLNERDSVVIDNNDALTLQSLLAVGTSAGGRQMKAIIAINQETGEMRSGQTDYLEGYDYYIIKFGDALMPTAEIETSCHFMALEAGIDMEESRMLRVEGVNHFLTKRFDRRAGQKIHVQTLAAINPEARSYEDLFDTCRALMLSETELQQLYARMVFNVLINNTDDHNKNFAFCLQEGGRWQLAPAYDITFILNIKGTGPNIDRRFSIGGKTRDIEKSDLLEFAKQNNIRNASEIIDRVVQAIGKFATLSNECGITQPWKGIIQKTLNENLASFGLLSGIAIAESITDVHGRKITDVSICVNAKGHYDVTVVIDGIRHRRFVRPSMPLYSYLQQHDISTVSHESVSYVVEQLFTVD